VATTMSGGASVREVTDKMRLFAIKYSTRYLLRKLKLNQGCTCQLLPRGSSQR
jgi:hypothetical protein